MTTPATHTQNYDFYNYPKQKKLTKKEIKEFRENYKFDGELYEKRIMAKLQRKFKKFDEMQEYRALKTRYEKRKWRENKLKNFDKQEYEARMLELEAIRQSNAIFSQIFHQEAQWTKNYRALNKVFSKSEVSIIGKLEELQRLANIKSGTKETPFFVSWSNVCDDLGITAGSVSRALEVLENVGILEVADLSKEQEEHNNKVHYKKRFGRKWIFEYENLEGFLYVCKTITDLEKDKLLKEYQGILKKEFRQLRFYINNKKKLTKEGRADEYKYGLENSIKTIILIVNNLDKKENIITQEVTPAPVETPATPATQAPQQKITFEKTHDKEKDRDMDGMNDNQAFRAMGLKPQVSAMLEIAKNSEHNDKIKGIMPRDIFNKIRLKTEEDYRQQAENLKDDMRFQNEKEIQENGLKRFAPTAEYYFELFDFFLEDFKEFYNTYKYEFETSTGRPVCIRKLYYYFKHQFLKDKSSGTPFRVCNDYLFFTELTKGKRLMAHPDYIFEETNYYRDYKGICRTALQGGYDPDNEKLNELYNQIREGFKNMEQHDRRRVRKWAEITQDFVTMGSKETDGSIIAPRYQAQYDKVLQKQEELRKKD